MKQYQIDRISKAIEDILRYHQDVIVSLHEIHKILINDYFYYELEETELESIIQNDPRFEYIDMPDYFQHFDETQQEFFEEQKILIPDIEYYSGPRVKLANVNISIEKIIEILNRKVNNMMEILITLWNNRPTDDTYTEDQLLQILAKAQKMQREIKSLTESKNITDILQIIKKVSDEK